MSSPDQDSTFPRNPEWEQHRDQNVTIAQRIQTLFLRYRIPENAQDDILDSLLDAAEEVMSLHINREEAKDEYRYNTERNRTVGDGIVLTKITDPGLVIHIDIGYVRDMRNWGEFLHIPSDFHFPAYKLMKLHHEKIIPVKTPYGILPSDVIGADGRLYSFMNYTFFNRFGQAAQYLDVHRVGGDDQTLSEVLENNDLTEVELMKLDFITSADDSRTITLDQTDYKEVDDILKQIEAGEFIPTVF